MISKCTWGPLFLSDYRYCADLTINGRAITVDGHTVGLDIIVMREMVASLSGRISMQQGGRAAGGSRCGTTISTF